MNLLFNAGIVNLLLKPMGEATEGLILFFVVWSALIVGGWVVVAWGRKSCIEPVKIASFAVSAESEISSFCF